MESEEKADETEHKKKVQSSASIPYANKRQ